VVQGIAPGGGLYVPASLPPLDLQDILAMAEWPYWRRAAAVFTHFGVDLPAQRVEALMRRAYGRQWDHEAIAPVVQAAPGLYVLELWHGPTSAFKDMALQCMPLFFSDAVDRLQTTGEIADDFLVLVATSGDTGKAALEGFADREHTSVAVLYPDAGVSDIQRLQMVTQRGSNIVVFGVHGNFDDCQSAVKATFNDALFAATLHERYGLRLSSANSINWGRLLPQVVYYVSAYADMVASGSIAPGHPIDVCVPTGNFGNILGAYYARLIGVPIDRLLCASNENNVLTDFIGTGTYDILARDFVKTPSPSMDILVSSNLERLLFHEAGADAVRSWMAELAENRRFTVDRDTFGRLRETFVADWTSNETSLRTIDRVHREHGYLMDPHTAVAWEIAERLRDANPVLVVSTAHWAKFGADVLKALTGTPYGASLDPQYSSMSGLEMLDVVRTLAPGGPPIPVPLAELATLPRRFDTAIDAGPDEVERALVNWLEAR